MSPQEQKTIETLFDAMATAGVSVTTGTRTDSHGTRRIWEWWDWDSGSLAARGETVESLVAHLESK